MMNSKTIRQVISLSLVLSSPLSFAISDEERIDNEKISAQGPLPREEGEESPLLVTDIANLVSAKLDRVSAQKLASTCQSLHATLHDAHVASLAGTYLDTGNMDYPFASYVSKGLYLTDKRQLDRLYHSITPSAIAEFIPLTAIGHRFVFSDRTTCLHPQFQDFFSSQEGMVEYRLVDLVLDALDNTAATRLQCAAAQHAFAKISLFAASENCDTLKSRIRTNPEWLLNFLEQDYVPLDRAMTNQKAKYLMITEEDLSSPPSEAEVRQHLSDAGLTPLEVEQCVENFGKSTLSMLLNVHLLYKDTPLSSKIPVTLEQALSRSLRAITSQLSHSIHSQSISISMLEDTYTTTLLIDYCAGGSLKLGRPTRKALESIAPWPIAFTNTSRQATTVYPGFAPNLTDETNNFGLDLSGMTSLTRIEDDFMMVKVTEVLDISGLPIEHIGDRFLGESSGLYKLHMSGLDKLKHIGEGAFKLVQGPSVVELPLRMPMMRNFPKSFMSNFRFCPKMVLDLSGFSAVNAMPKNSGPFEYSDLEGRDIILPPKLIKFILNIDVDNLPGYRNIKEYLLQRQQLGNA